MTHAPLDVLIIGGGFAGLSAALYSARGMKRGVVVTAGPSRNAPSRQAHGVFTQDGEDPVHLLQVARDQLRPYDFPVLEAGVIRVAGENGAFIATLADGQTVQARKIILATGVRDLLPDEPTGLREEWGKGVHHCAYCYGWEIRDGPTAFYQAALGGTSGVQSILYHQKISRDILVCSDRSLDFTPEQRELLETRGAHLMDAPLVRVDGREGGVRLTFQDGTVADRAVLYAHGERRGQVELAVQLGCEVTPSGIQVDAQQMTTIPGVYAAGDVTSGNQIAFAVAGGARAAMFAASALFYDDLPDGAKAEDA
ncbi:NAD(P)/FAD-dependent oxidoreductase [Deinococcus aquatilis]|uniref:NAD(P)/FAD-dependent oxidoreductase n=1 Tax=Deinococcus aquatilis TaxID=519440 RepID=UPI000590C2FA|nr:NAD(P)/FAD-dependent oxidoreductase [Deinococcus aquatilis]